MPHAVSPGATRYSPPFVAEEFEGAGVEYQVKAVKESKILKILD